MKIAVQRRKNAQEFSDYWKDKGYEKGDSQRFWIGLLQDVYGVEDATKYISFEKEVLLDKTSFIDAMIPSTHVLIEQKGISKDLSKGILQSDGSFKTPYQQAKRYSDNLPYKDRPRWIVTSNFKQFNIYDMNKPNGAPEEILLSDLPKEYSRLDFLIDNKNEDIQKETAVSVKAGELIGQIYDALLAQYVNPKNPSSLKSLNQLCVRLTFCMYAEDDETVFGKRDIFSDYLAEFSPDHMRSALLSLFKVLDTPEGKRDPYLEPRLAEFPYVNGGMFSEVDIEIPNFTDELKTLLITKAARGFDWSRISPTIFGAVFEATLNPETRRAGGMHYTSIQNIHKVIDPLFLNELKARLEDIKSLKQPRTIARRVHEFQNELASLSFLDPACGSGNFLTETYLSLRRLENEAIEQIYGQNTLLDVNDKQLIQVSIRQFYGIEINDFAVSVAKTALWIAESQMFEETQAIIYSSVDFLPLKEYSNITEGNALRLDWNKVIPANQLNFIMGNPPFSGARKKEDAQKDDLKSIRPAIKNFGYLDYVAGWYFKAAQYMEGTPIQAAFVSTNSITQGQQVATLWEPLIRQYGMHINFAYRTFVWTSEAKQRAAVYCVIVGFGSTDKSNKVIFDDSGRPAYVQHISPYLAPTQDFFVFPISQPLCPAPTMGIGNKPVDGGNYLFTEQQMEKFISAEPRSKDLFKTWYGAREFVYKKPRYCLWLGECSPKELHSMPKVMERVRAVQQFRLGRESPGTKKLAERPTHFHVENMPKVGYLLIPRVGSDKRRYTPMGFMPAEVLAGDATQVVPSATLYDFGVLTSNVHMAWTRVVAGRLKGDPRYSTTVVYNNFPWPITTDAHKQRVADTAQKILDARNLYTDSTYAELYDEATMPSELRKAHQNNDRAVMEAYGMDVKTTTADSAVMELFKMYEALIKGTRDSDH